MTLPTTLRRTSLALALAASAAPSHAQMVSFDRMPGLTATTGLDSHKPAAYKVQEIAVTTGKTSGANVLWPGESAVFTFRITNPADAALTGPATVHVIGYGTRGTATDVWTPEVFTISTEPDIPLTLNVPAKGFQDVTVTPKIPARFGGYALIFDIPGQGRALGANLVRTLPADPGRVQNPTYALDLPYPQPEEAMSMLQKIGVKGFRTEFGFLPDSNPEYAKYMQRHIDYFAKVKAHELTALLTVEGTLYDPWNVPFRPYLNDKGEGKFQYPGDTVWPPKYDAQFRKWSRDIAKNVGWPNGPVNAMELWNEPWEGISISGWGADMLRYRDMYEAMALGVRDSRKEDGTYVLTGGACSSTNTRDKLFPDGDSKFLPYLDFISIHYQPMAADPALVPEWMNRPAAMGGPVRVWDTESWVGNSEDRVGGVIASMRSIGQSRTAGIFHGNVYSVQDADVDGKKVYVAQVYSPGAALAATQKFIGQRPFNQLVIKGGLPWVYEFGGRPLAPDDSKPGSIEDGTLVVLGDLGGLYERDKMLYRTVFGLKNRAGVDEAKAKMVGLATGTPEYDKAKSALDKATVLSGATMTIRAAKGFSLYDFYGNPVPAKNGEIVIPLNGCGFFLRGDGKTGSFARLRAAVQAARIDGIEPVELIARDMTSRVSDKPAVRISVTNILNRPITGTLKVALGKLTLDATEKKLTLAPHTSQDVVLTVTGGEPSADNQYPLSASFDAGADGRAPYKENIRVDLVSKRTITVDGDLGDWKDVLPQPVSGGIGASLTEQAWLPMVNWTTGSGSGLASGYMAYDDKNFYYAAKIADSTPYEGTVRFETRDDDQYFYPPVSYDTNQNNKEMVWPADTRRYSYRKDPDLPASAGSADSVQLAFNVLPPDKKPMMMASAGTEPRYQIYPDTDYEYALNEVAPKYGGGTEIWRLGTPGMPRKMFYPRQPKSPLDGPVKDGKLFIKRDGNTRIVECSIPWTEMPLVKQAIDAGRPTKFSFRINDNAGPAYELAADRGVSKINAFAFHNDWQIHWGNELEFGWEK